MLTEDYINRFGGIGRLYGKESLCSFLKARVMIIGLGGVGSWTAEALVRSGIGSLHLVDLDDICITNTNRQVPALEGNYGKMKSEALKERVLQINPDCEIITHEMFYSEKNAAALLPPQIDIVIDAIDSVKAKAHLLATCKEKEITVFSCGGAGGRKDISKIKIADLSKTTGDKLLSSVRTTLRKDYKFPSGDGKKTKKFGIKAVYSDEPMTEPQPCSLNNEEETSESSARNLNCATGYGAVTHATATFGLYLAQQALEQISSY